MTTWRYGDFKIEGRVGIFKDSDYESGRVYSYGSIPPVRNINYLTMWRQAVRNKFTGELKYLVGIPNGAKEVVPGQDVTIYPVNLNMTSDEIETVARESFAKLQELVIEYYNRPIA